MVEVEILGAPPGGADLPPESEMRRLSALAAAAGGVSDGHLAIEFVDATRIAQLNASFRGVRSATDVLSFPIDGRAELAGGVARELGDVVICPEQTADIREAIVYGVLHLVGFDHDGEDGEMLKLQRELLATEP
jgi:probable rRNA maturation factor